MATVADTDRITGRALDIDENDYLYGVGTLRLRIDVMTGMRSQPGWVLVTGTVESGAETDSCTVVVRLSALRRHLPLDRASTGAAHRTAARRSVARTQAIASAPV